MVVVTTRVEHADAERIDQLAAARGVSRSVLVREMVSSFLNDEDPRNLPEWASDAFPSWAVPA